MPWKKEELEIKRRHAKLSGILHSMPRQLIVEAKLAALVCGLHHHHTFRAYCVNAAGKYFTGRFRFIGRNTTKLRHMKKLQSAAAQGSSDADIAIMVKGCFSGRYLPFGKTCNFLSETVYVILIVLILNEIRAIYGRAHHCVKCESDFFQFFLSVL